MNICALKDVVFDWSEGKRTTSLMRVYMGDVAGKIDGAIRWYQVKRSTKRKLAWWFRVGAIVLGTFAAAMPTISEISLRHGIPAGSGDVWWLRPGLATIVAFVVCALIMLDRLIGASTSWVRYTMAETALKELRDELAVAYVLEVAQWAGQPGQSDASVEQTKHTLAVLQSFIARANQIVRDETNQWRNEFQSALAQTEEYAKMQPSKTEEAVLTIKLANPERLAEPMWSASINAGPDQVGSTDTKTTRVSPGPVILRVKALVKSGPNDTNPIPFSTEAGEILTANTVKIVTIALPG